MVFLPDLDETVTGDGDSDDESGVSGARRHARKAVVEHVTDDTVPPGALPDGGLMPQTMEWLEATQGADIEAAKEYDRKLREQRRLEDGLPVPPSGKTVSDANFFRSVSVNEARAALGEYRELTDE